MTMTGTYSDIILNIVTVALVCFRPSFCIIISYSAFLLPWLIGYSSSSEEYHLAIGAALVT